ncbi:MAG: TlyA family RNA methyltransferase [Candidatus Caenarcaniphilales bacterium]|nr:TlyA family RNA methyltransferase [Candidatus Caenarcaniphilales bacterium]
MGRRAQNTKKQLVEFLVDNYFKEENEALTAVKLGVVYVNGKLIKRPGIIVDEESDKVKVVGEGKIFVSRGGYKLQEALKVFGLSLNDRVCLDIGTSTGGFSDCMLQYGAKSVFAIDTGYGQLDWKIRTDERVTTVERMNVRYLLPERLYGNSEFSKATFAAIDVSFISVIKIIPSIQNLLAGPDKSELAILVKPQFEAGKNQVGRGGLIKNPTIHLEILSHFVSSCYRAGLDIRKIIHSPLLGASGNLEFLAYATWPKAGPNINPQLNDWLSKIIDIAYAHHGLKE